MSVASTPSAVPTEGQAPSETTCVRHDGRLGSRGRRLGAVALVAAGATLLGTGAFASWQATANATSGSLQAATVGASAVGATGGQLTTPVSNLLPGDWLYRYVDITNTSTVPATFTGSVTGTGLASGLQVAVDTCSAAWTIAGSTCSGTTTSLVAAGTPLSSASAINHGQLAPNAVQRVRYRITVDPNAATALQGTSSTLTLSVLSNLSGGLDRTAG